MSITEVLSRSARIFWKYKGLWLFGIFPLLLYFLFAGIAFFIDFPLTSFMAGQTSGLVPAGWPYYFPNILIGIAALVVCLSAILFGTSATVSGTFEADQGGERLSYAVLLRNSWPYFWKLFGLYALIGLAVLLLMAILMGCIIAGAVATMGIASLCTFPLFFLIIPLELVVAAGMEQAQAAIVLDRLGIFASLKQAWLVLKGNFWKICLMGLILYGGNYVLSFLLTLPLMAVFWLIPFTGMGAGDNQSFDNLFVIAVIIFLGIMPLISIVQGLATTYLHSAWALTYLRLTRLPESRPSPAAEPAKPPLVNA